jgi:hypothetical protein
MEIAAFFFVGALVWSVLLFVLMVLAIKKLNKD